MKIGNLFCAKGKASLLTSLTFPFKIQPHPAGEGPTFSPRNGMEQRGYSGGPWCEAPFVQGLKRCVSKGIIHPTNQPEMSQLPCSRSRQSHASLWPSETHHSYFRRVNDKSHTPRKELQLTLAASFRLDFRRLRREEFRQYT